MEVEEMQEQNGTRKRNLTIFAVVVAVLALGGIVYGLHARQFEETDDAQIDGNLSPISARVDGTIVKVHAENNQVVHEGDLLVELDARDYEVRLAQAKAQLAQAQSMLAGQQPFVPMTEVQNSVSITSARAQLASAQAAVAVAERDRDQAAAQVESQKAGNVRAQNDLERYRQLSGKQEISKSEFDQHEAVARQQAAGLQAAQAGLQAAERGVDVRKAQLEQAKSALVQVEKNAAPQMNVRRAAVSQQQAMIEAAEAAVKQAELALSYTKVYAPVTGVVLKRSAQVGAHVMPGQQVLTIAQNDAVWVTSNFKETQLMHMQPGQTATVHVDALNRDFNGVVESVGGATGALASLLPPENATGNYVKVVQRIPVRIRLNAGQEALDRLRPGMSVEPQVHVR